MDRAIGLGHQNGRRRLITRDRGLEPTAIGLDLDDEVIRRCWRSRRRRSGQAGRDVVEGGDSHYRCILVMSVTGDRTFAGLSTKLQKPRFAQPIQRPHGFAHLRAAKNWSLRNI